MDADKVPTIVESCLTNGGKQTVAEADLATGAAAPSHYHTDFTEAFTLLSGSLTVWTSDDLTEENLKPIELEVGKEVSVPPNTLHKFLANKDTKARVVFTPGTIGFERMLLIMRGTQQDGSYPQLSSPDSERAATFYSILGELTNTIFVGEAKTKLDGFEAANGPMIEATKQELIARYASDDHLKKAAGL
jgi:quercetin dioxygenase-like cupin family protein